MQAVRQYAQVVDHQIHIQLPQDFNHQEVEVLVLPKPSADAAEHSAAPSLGKIGHLSASFAEDDEDYSQ